MSDEIYNENGNKGPIAATEQLASYKLKKVLAQLNMSTFDYDIKKDTVYVRKENVLLHDFTEHWFEDGGDFYYLENLMGLVNQLVRTSFITATLEGIEKIRNNTSGEMVTLEVPIAHEKGNTRWTNFMVDTMLDDEGRPSYAVGYCRDINEQKKELYRVYNVAKTDGLTGMRNRITGIHKIETRIREDIGDSHFLAVLDLNNFKSANDLFGHSFGDTILKNVADRIRQFEDHDTISSRTGGDEFMVFRKCDDEAHAMRLLTDLKNLLRHTETAMGQPFEVEASIGFSIQPAQGVGFDELYNKADIAMYYAKQNKTEGPIFYDASMPAVRK